MLTDRLPQMLAKDSKSGAWKSCTCISLYFTLYRNQRHLDARFDPIHSLKPFIDEVNFCLYCWEKELYTFYLRYVYHHHTLDVVKTSRGLSILGSTPRCSKFRGFENQVKLWTQAGR